MMNISSWEMIIVVSLDAHKMLDSKWNYNDGWLEETLGDSSYAEKASYLELNRLMKATKRERNKPWVIRGLYYSSAEEITEYW